MFPASPVKIAAQVQGFDWEAQLNPKDRKHVREQCRSLWPQRAKRSPIPASQPNEFSLEQRRSFGVVLGTGGGGLAFTEQQYSYWYHWPCS